MSEGIHDVRPEQYPTVIREMIRHENDVTNHRIMWLLVGQGFIANAFVSAKTEATTAYSFLSVVGTLVALSAFVMLYRSYQARGYLQFLGLQAKQGTLPEDQLPLVGWPRKRVKNWWRSVWMYPWLRRTLDLFEPWLILPFLFTTMWMIVVLRARSGLNTAVVAILGLILAAILLSGLCIVIVWSQSKEDENIEG